MHRTIRFAPFIAICFLCSCSSVFLNVPTVEDESVEQYVRDMGLKIVAVSEHRERAASFRFRLANFARRDILGLSLGNQRIFISYELSRRALTSSHYRWLLRHTLAHEIAHDVLGGDIAAPRGAREASPPALANRITARDLGLPPKIKFRPYSRWAELAADRKAMEYWQRLGWHCGHWVKLFTLFVQAGYVGDADHPTQERLEQAVEVCSSQQPLVSPVALD